MLLAGRLRVVVVVAVEIILLRETKGPSIILVRIGEVDDLAWAKENPMSRLPMIAKSDRKMRQEGRISINFQTELI